jgi:hypothetical protein
MYKHGHHFSGYHPRTMGFIHLPFIQCYKEKRVIKSYVIPIIWKGDITKKIGFARWKKHEGKRLADHPYRFDLFLNYPQMQQACGHFAVRFYHLFPAWRFDFDKLSEHAGVISLQERPVEGEEIKSLEKQLPKIEREEIRRRKAYTKNIMQSEMLSASIEVNKKEQKDGGHKISPSGSTGFQPVPIPKPYD